MIGENPDQESDTNLLDFQVMRQMARNLKHNTELNEKNRSAVVADGAHRRALRVALSKFDKVSRITRLRYSETRTRWTVKKAPT